MLMRSISSIRRATIPIYLVVHLVVIAVQLPVTSGDDDESPLEGSVRLRHDGRYVNIKYKNLCNSVQRATLVVRSRSEHALSAPMKCEIDEVGRFLRCKLISYLRRAVERVDEAILSCTTTDRRCEETCCKECHAIIDVTSAAGPPSVNQATLLLPGMVLSILMFFH